jgi:protein-S-isoprenylcysteine O-methyltransferase Ste14
MSEVPSNAMRLKKVGRRGMRYVAQRLGLLLVFALVLFGSAGRLDWPRAWGFLVLTLLLEGGSLTVLGILAPETLNQRGTFGPGVTAFDRVFAVVWLGLSMGSAAVAGLDAVRFGWSKLPIYLFYVGGAVVCLAFALGTWAMLENRHFEQLVRIQEERGHRVVTSGPYRIVRHPGYLGTIVGTLATPAMLGSAWMFVPAGLLAILFVVRTHLEDQFLRRELSGYEEYTARTRFRLVPMIW